MRVKVVIDRFESDKAVLLVGDSEVSASWPRASLPAEAREGDILWTSFAVDREATARARSEAEDLLRKLMEKNRDR